MHKKSHGQKHNNEKFLRKFKDPMTGEEFSAEIDFELYYISFIGMIQSIYNFKTDLVAR